MTSRTCDGLGAVSFPPPVQLPSSQSCSVSEALPVVFSAPPGRQRFPHAFGTKTFPAASGNRKCSYAARRALGIRRPFVGSPGMPPGRNRVELPPALLEFEEA